MKTCKICGYINKDEANRCPVCKSEFNMSTVSGASEGQKNGSFGAALVILLIISAISTGILIGILRVFDETAVISTPWILLGIFALIFVVSLMVYTLVIRPIKAFSHFTHAYPLTNDFFCGII